VSAANSNAAAAPSVNVVADGIASSTVTVTLRDATGNAIAGLAAGDFALSVTGSAVLGTIAPTGAPGTYAFTVTNTVAQSVTVTIVAGGVTLTQQPTIQFIAGTPTLVALHTGDGQSATIGTQVATAPAVIVRDANSNPVPGVTVTFAVETGGGSLAGGGIVTTDGSGIATSPAWTLGTVAGPNTLSATVPGVPGSPNTFTATATAGTATQLAMVTQPSATAQ